MKNSIGVIRVDYCESEKIEEKFFKNRHRSFLLSEIARKNMRQNVIVIRAINLNGEIATDEELLAINNAVIVGEAGPPLLLAVNAFEKLDRIEANVGCMTYYGESLRDFVEMNKNDIEAVATCFMAVLLDFTVLPANFDVTFETMRIMHRVRILVESGCMVFVSISSDASLIDMSMSINGHLCRYFDGHSDMFDILKKHIDSDPEFPDLRSVSECSGEFAFLFTSFSNNSEISSEIKEIVELSKIIS